MDSHLYPYYLQGISRRQILMVVQDSFYIPYIYSMYIFRKYVPYIFNKQKKGVFLESFAVTWIFFTAPLLPKHLSITTMQAQGALGSPANSSMQKKKGHLPSRKRPLQPRSRPTWPLRSTRATKWSHRTSGIHPTHRSFNDREPVRCPLPNLFQQIVTKLWNKNEARLS